MNTPEAIAGEVERLMELAAVFARAQVEVLHHPTTGTIGDHKRAMDSLRTALTTALTERHEAGMLDGMERAAVICDEGQETIRTGGEETTRFLTPRSHGNLSGLAYAAAIRTSAAAMRAMEK